MVRPVTCLGDRLRLGRLGPDLTGLERVEQPALGVRGQGVQRLPRQRELPQLLGGQLPVRHVNRDETAGLVVTERHPIFNPPFETGRIQRPGFGQQFTDTQTHPVDRGEHLALDLLEA
jgi:hypothetical protein